MAEAEGSSTFSLDRASPSGMSAVGSSHFLIRSEATVQKGIYIWYYKPGLGGCAGAVPCRETIAVDLLNGYDMSIMLSSK